MGEKMRGHRNQKNQRSYTSCRRRYWKSMDDRTTNSTRRNCARWSIVRGMCVGIEAEKIPDRSSAGYCGFGDLSEGVNVCGYVSQAIGEKRTAGANRDLFADGTVSAGYRDGQGLPHLEAPNYQRNAPAGAGVGPKPGYAKSLGQRVGLYLQA